MKQQTKAAAPLQAGIDELRANEATMGAAYEAKVTEVAGLQERLNNPLPADTTATLGAIDEKLGVASRDLVLLKRDYETAAAVRAQAEQAETAEHNRLRRQDLQRRLDEAANTMPDQQAAAARRRVFVDVRAACSLADAKQSWRSAVYSGTA